MQAIRTATVTASELLGWSDRIGTVEAGKWADIVAVPGGSVEGCYGVGASGVCDEGRGGGEEGDVNRKLK